MDDCPVCGHKAKVTLGPDIRGGGMLQRMWRAECAADQLCSAPTFTRFTRESAEASWNGYARRLLAVPNAAEMIRFQNDLDAGDDE